MSETKVTYDPKWLGLLGVIFVVAKVFEIGPVAEWSWWLVLLPFYLSLAILLGVIVFGAIVFGSGYGVLTLIEKYQDRKRKVAIEKRKMWLALQNKHGDDK